LYLPRFYGTSQKTNCSLLERRLGIRVLGPPETDKLNTQQFERCERLVFKGTMRPDQLAPANAMFDALDKIGGGVISLQCGGGKTCIGIYVSCDRKLPTAVVCHTTAMMKQYANSLVCGCSYGVTGRWQERIQQFCPTARIGVVQQAKADIEDKDFVIMSVKTVALREYPKGCFDRIGMVIWDEIHLMCKLAKVAKANVNLFVFRHATVQRCIS